MSLFAREGSGWIKAGEKCKQCWICDRPKDSMICPACYKGFCKDHASKKNSKYCKKCVPSDND